jgi:hypothetical protein
MRKSREKSLPTAVDLMYGGARSDATAEIYAIVRHSAGTTRQRL